MTFAISVISILTSKNLNYRYLQSSFWICVSLRPGDSLSKPGDVSMSHGRVELFRQKLDNLSVSDYYGLNGPGLTCYLNSVLQVLFMTEDFRTAVKQCCGKDSATIDLHLARLFADLQRTVAKADDVAEGLGITDVYEQRDAAEYFEKILCLTSLEAAQIFKGELNHKTTCLKCKERSESRSFFWTLPVTVEESYGWAYSVERGLKAFFKGEKICGDNKVYCNRCETKQDADFGCEITQNPEVLTLLLKRFSFDYKSRCYVKLHCKVKFPQTLHINGCKYTLYAIVNHSGNMKGGHYTAQIRSFENHVWYHFNDEMVKLIRPQPFGDGVKSQKSYTAYLLMYRKDVETEERLKRAEGGKALVHHQLTDKTDNTVSKQTPNSSVELEKQPKCRAACVWPPKIIFPPVDAAADGDKQSLQTRKSESAELQRGAEAKMNEPNRQQLDADSKEHMRHLDTRGRPRERLRAHSVVKQKERLKTSETHNNMATVSHCSFTKVKSAEAVVVSNEMEEEVIDGRSEHGGEVVVPKNAATPQLARLSPSQCSEIDPTVCFSSLNPHRKACRKGAKEKMQRAVTPDGSCQLETFPTVTEGERSKRKSEKFIRQPWRC